MLLAATAGAAQVQSVPAPQAASAQAGRVAQGASPAQLSQPAKLPTGSDRRRAAKLYLAAATLYQDELFEQALKDYEDAAKLDPTNADYAMAVEVARSHAVTSLIQEAARDSTRGDTAGARYAQQRALASDP